METVRNEMQTAQTNVTAFAFSVNEPSINHSDWIMQSMHGCKPGSKLLSSWKQHYWYNSYFKDSLNQTWHSTGALTAEHTVPKLQTMLVGLTFLGNVRTYTSLTYT